MNCDKVKSDLQVQTHAKLGKTTGMIIKENHLSVRKPKTKGTVLSYVPGHGGDVWFVKHEGSEEIGAYCFNEFKPVK